jgi:hypothetical protein
MSDDFGDPSMSKPDVSANSWLTHFQSLHAEHTLETEQNNILQKLTKLEEKTPNNFQASKYYLNYTINFLTLF